MKEFAADPEPKVHPQTVIEHFGTWNAAKRAAGLVPRRYVTREELLRLLRALGDELGRMPTARDLDERRGRMPSKSLYWHTFGSLSAALREAGYDVTIGEERLERAVEQGVGARAGDRAAPAASPTGRAARRGDPALLTEWQVYRMFDVAARGVGDLPVPRPRPAARAGARGAERRLGRRRLRRAAALARGCDRGERG